MKKIVWISSYPKSENTWVRYFLSNIINFKLDTNQIKFSTDQSNFYRLRKLEDLNSFAESKNKFFNSGKIGQWKKILSKEQIERIENYCSEEMIELGYPKQ